MRFDHLEIKGDVSFYQGEGGVVYQLVQLENDQLMIPSNLGLAKETRNLLIRTYKTYQILYDGLGKNGFLIEDQNGFLQKMDFGNATRQWIIFQMSQNFLVQGAEI